MNTYMAMALEEAFRGMRENHGGPFGAVVVHKGRIISRAHNEVLSSNDPTAHAEIVAIRRASKELGDFTLEGCEMYTSCEPCPMCLAAIIWSRIKRIYHGCTRDDAAEIGFDDRKIYHSMGIRETNDMLEKIMTDRQECLRAFREWAEKPGKIIY